VEGEAAAVAALESHTTDVVILDLNLKDGSGLGVLRHLRAQQSVAEAIIFSNSNNSAYRLEADRLGASLFLDKACDLERLMERLLTRSIERARHLHG
jgi:DNA-binding NarL/FixJ family response regulator